jgi:hypothetical protein
MYTAGQLKSYLDNLTLVGQDEEGYLEWIGSNQMWAKQFSDELKAKD